MKTKNIDANFKWYETSIGTNAKRLKWQIIACCFVKIIFINKNTTKAARQKIKPDLNLASSTETALNLSKMWCLEKPE